MQECFRVQAAQNKNLTTLAHTSVLRV